MAIARSSKVLLAAISLFYLAYVAGSAIFLNTDLLAKVADMENHEQTYVSFHGAISPFPGFLYISHSTLFISDQNVSITIDLTHAWARFSVFGFIKKQIVVTDLRVKDAKVNLGLKSIDESTTFQRKYLKAEDLDLEKRTEKVKVFEKSHFTLIFKKIIIDTISEIKSDLGDFKGNIGLSGSFLIQPKVQVEVFPTTLKFFSGEVPGQFSSVEGEAKVQINRFRMIDAPGNAVFPYFNADLKLDVGLKSLHLLDMTLRKLPGYAFEGTDTRFSLRAEVIKGMLQKGSEANTTPSELGFQLPGLTAHGFGDVKWEVESENTSKLSAHLQNVSVRQSKDEVSLGTVKHVYLGARLYGNELVDAFHGVATILKLDSLRWNVASKNPNPNLQYNGLITGSGELRAYTGTVPQVEKRKSQTTALNLKIEKAHLHTSFLSDLNGTGSISVRAFPIDLSESAIQFPDVVAKLDLDVGKFGMVKSEAKFIHLEHQYFPNDSWKGNLIWNFDQTNPFVDLLRDQDKMSAILGTVARVKNLSIKLDCEISEGYTWLRFNEVNSDGIWKAYGTLTNQDEGMRGAFEARVMSLPIGIRIQPDKTDVKFLPSAEWFDESQSEILRGVQ